MYPFDLIKMKQSIKNLIDTGDMSDETLSEIINDAYTIVSKAPIDQNNVDLVTKATKYKALSMLWSIVDDTAQNVTSDEAGRFQTEYNTEPVNRWEGLYTSLISNYGVGTWGIQFG